MNRMPGPCLTISAPSFTEKQGQNRAFIHAYTLVLGWPPTEADLQRHFRVTSPSVHQMVLTLERAGLIHRRPGVACSIELLIYAAAPTSQLRTNRQMLCAKVLAP